MSLFACTDCIKLPSHVVLLELLRVSLSLYPIPRVSSFPFFLPASFSRARWECITYSEGNCLCLSLDPRIVSNSLRLSFSQSFCESLKPSIPFLGFELYLPSCLLLSGPLGVHHYSPGIAFVCIHELYQSPLARRSPGALLRP